MPVHFSVTSSEDLVLNPGPPPGYCGFLLKGVSTMHAKAYFGTVFLQEISTDLISFGKIYIDWKRPGRLLCRYNYLPGVFTQTTGDNQLHEFVKAIGEIHLERGQFYSLTGSCWNGWMLAEKAGLHTMTNMSWSADFLDSILLNDPQLDEAVQNIYPNSPERIIGPPHALNADMRRILFALEHFDYSSASATDFLHEQMKKYFALVLKESREYRGVRKTIRESDWQVMCRIQQLIHEDPYRHYNIPELCMKMGTNEYKLRTLFPRLTGFSADDYRKYILLTKVGRKIVMSDKPMKSFHEEAGYTEESAFCRAFRKIFFCTPARLRSEDWDLDNFLPKQVSSNK